MPSAATSVPNLLLDELIRAGIDYAVGVPDRQLHEIIQRLSEGIDLDFALREDIAVAMAAGAYLAGRHPVVFMKNAGLGHSIDGLMSLTRASSIPLVLLIGWAGSGSDFLPHHVVMGRITLPLLDALGINTRVIHTSLDLDGMGAFVAEAFRNGGIYAVLVEPNDASDVAEAGSRPQGEVASAEGDFLGRMATARIVGKWAAQRELPLFVGNGFVLRDVFAEADAPSNFYLFGGMGLASGVALGFARFWTKDAVILEGDGNFYMGLPGAAMCASSEKKLLHVVFSNRSYESSGGQPLSWLHSGNAEPQHPGGYARVLTARTEEELTAALDYANKHLDPTLIWVRGAAGGQAASRPTLNSQDVMTRFRAWLRVAKAGS